MENDWKKTSLFHNDPKIEAFLKDDAPDPEYEYFKAEFKKRTGILLNLYKEKQMKRRICALIERKGLTDYQGLLTFLDANQAEMNHFIDYITINVTEFFRTPEHWKYIEENILTSLINSPKEKIRIWSCACSTGEEPYSIAISLHKLTQDLSRFQIIASDLDLKVLNIAKEAIYTENTLADVSLEIRERYFVKHGEHYRLIDEISSAVEFKKIDLLQDPFPQECDLILCRNVLIYFTEEAKENIYQQIRDALVPNGYLFTGNAEQIIYYKKYGFHKINGYTYQKK